MKKRLLMLFAGIFFAVASALSQQKAVTGKVTSAEEGVPLPGVSVLIKGTTRGTSTDINGNFAINASATDILVFKFLGTVPQEKTVGSSSVMNVVLSNDTKTLNEIVLTALGQTTQQRSLGTSQQQVKGADIAQTQRENFINALQGRVAGVDVTSTSGIPGSSSSITIRGVSSISGSNQPLMIVDGLPVDNKTLNSGVFYSDISATTAFSNRTTDFTNRSADINPEDIENLVVLKGPEAAALYGIDAANGAIVITTKKGKAGTGSISYSNSFRIDKTRGQPEIQNVFGLGTTGAGNVISTTTIPVAGTYQYFGPTYAPGTKFYDNIGNFFQSAFTQKHNLSFDGGTDKVTYRIATSYTGQEGVVPNSELNKLNLTGSTSAKVNNWLKTDLSINYAYTTNNQPLKGSAGPLIGLLNWPQTDDAQNYLLPSGSRRLLAYTTIGSGETDNPYFSINKNLNTSVNNRVIANFGLTITPFKWVSVKSNIGIDGYTTQYQIVKHPESAIGAARAGTIDEATDVTRNINMQNLFNFTKQKLTKDISIDGTLGTAIQSLKSAVDDGYGENFQDPNFVSLNNTNTRFNKTSIAQRRVVSFFSRATLSYKDYLYLTGTLRNDRTSTIPIDRYSFYYPSVSGSFVFTDAFKGLEKFMTSGKIRAAYAEVGKDARPYAYTPSLESKLTTGSGYGYGFTGPNPNLKPEFAKSVEIGAELAFLEDRLGIDVTVYKKKTIDQIVNDIRSSYGTGFILLNLNGGSTENKGIELTLRGDVVKKKDFEWSVLTNFESARGKVLALPNSLPESYVSDTWLYGNVRNGVTPGHSTRALSGFFYLKNKDGQLLITPGTGLPVRSTLFIDAGYDRQPDFSIGLTNTFNYKNLSLSFLLDFRKGGDILNATEHYLTTVGLSKTTEDRLTSRVIPGVLQDGKENTATPTINNIGVTPYYQNAYYTSMSEELFIEKNINWMRLRDVTLNFKLPTSMLKKQGFVKNASVFVTGTDLFLITNYSGLDPVVNGNSAAVGGSGGNGIDFGNFPMPIGLNFGVKIGL